MKTKINKEDTQWFTGMQLIAGVLGQNSASASTASPAFIQSNALMQSLVFAQSEDDLQSLWKDIKWKSVALPHQLIMVSLNPWAIKHAPFDWLDISNPSSSKVKKDKEKNKQTEDFIWGGTYSPHEDNWMVGYVLQQFSYQDPETAQNFLNTLFAQRQLSPASTVNSFIFGGISSPTKLIDAAITYARHELVEQMWKKTTWNDPQSAQDTIHALCNRVFGGFASSGLSRLKQSHLTPLLNANPNLFAPLKNSTAEQAQLLVMGILKSVTKVDGQVFKILAKSVFEQLTHQPLSTQKMLADFLVELSPISIRSGDLYDFVENFIAHAHPDVGAQFSRALLHHMCHGRFFDLTMLPVGIKGVEGTWGIDEARLLLSEIADLGPRELIEYKRKKKLPDLMACFDPVTQELVNEPLMALYATLKNHSKLPTHKYNAFVERWKIEVSVLGQATNARTQRKM